MKYRFEKKFEINKETGCWQWNAAKHGRGYGYFHTNAEYSSRKMDYAHRVSWYIYKGERVDDGVSVCHKCDNPSCVNPDHLFLGSHADNMKDMRNKGRMIITGEKLNKRQVEIATFMREHMGVPVNKIASLFRIDPGHASRITRGQRSYYNSEENNV